VRGAFGRERTLRRFPGRRSTCAPSATSCGSCSRACGSPSATCSPAS
jgi:hypothetical protein